MSKSIIPFIEFGGQGPVIHFSHANGFPTGAYRQLIDPFLKKYKVIGALHRPLWGNQDYRQLSSWNSLADDLIQFLDKRKLKNIIGMGHSLGGTVSAIAAMSRPDLFSRLVLIDPVIFPAYFIWPNQVLPQFIRKKIVPPAKIALKRKDQWTAKSEVYESWRKKKVFRQFSDEVLTDLVEAAIVPHQNGGVGLAYSKEWEAQVYITAPSIFTKVKQLKTPMIVVKGEHSNVLMNRLWTNWKKAQPDNHFIEHKGAGHLVPLEYPAALAKQLMDLL